MDIKVTGARKLVEFSLFGLDIVITDTFVSSVVVMLILVIASYFLGRNLKKRPGRTQALTEKLVSMLYNMVGDTMGKHNLSFAPYIGALF